MSELVLQYHEGGGCYELYDDKGSEQHEPIFLSKEEDECSDDKDGHEAVVDAAFATDAWVVHDHRGQVEGSDFHYRNYDDEEIFEVLTTVTATEDALQNAGQ